MNPHTTRNIMTNRTTEASSSRNAGLLLLGLAGGIFLAGCGPTFDPASLIASTRVLGARPVAITGHPVVLLVLPGDTPETLAALAVAPTCSSANTGLSAERIVHRP